jgi:hypothetical protein
MGGSAAKQIGQTNNLSPEQNQALRALFQGLDPLGAAQRISDPMQAGTFFEETVAIPQRQQFQQNVLPQITEQFAGATSGSGFNRALGQSLSDFEGQLAAQRAGYQKASEGQQLELLRSLLGVNAVSPIIQQPRQGFGGLLGGGLGQGLGQVGTNYLSKILGL